MDKIEILKKYFGFDKLKKEQEEIIDSILNKKDTVGLLPTGFGKSITFQLPAMILDGLTIAEFAQTTIFPFLNVGSIDGPDIVHGVIT